MKPITKTASKIKNFDAGITRLQEVKWDSLRLMWNFLKLLILWKGFWMKNFKSHLKSPVCLIRCIPQKGSPYLLGRHYANFYFYSKSYLAVSVWELVIIDYKYNIYIRYIYVFIYIFLLLLIVIETDEYNKILESEN